MLFTMQKALESEFVECSYFSEGMSPKDALMDKVTNRSHCGTKESYPFGCHCVE